jgi:lysophospholipase L1-like esterase
MANYPPEKSPMAGWGQMLPALCKEGVEVVNGAANGRSSKSFIAEGRLARILERIEAGDVLLIQFAHNDEKPDEERRTEPFTTYQQHLTMYIEGARQRGAQPILLTPVQRRHYDEAGRLLDTHGDYPAAMKQLVAKLDVPLVDLMPLTGALYDSFGPEQSKRLFTWLAPGEHPNYPEGSQDDTHFNEHGAALAARLAADEMRRMGLPLAAWLLPV